MKRFFLVLAMIAVLVFSSSTDCKSSEPASDYKQRLLQAKEKDEAELAQWKNRRNQLDLAQAGNASARRFTGLAKPNEDPTNVARFSSAPSDYKDDVAECDEHIAMLTENIKYYDKELEKLEQPEKSPVSDDQKEEDDGEDFKLNLDLGKVVNKVLSDLHDSQMEIIKNSVNEAKKALSNQGN